MAKKLSMIFEMGGKLAASFRDATRGAAGQLSDVEKKAKAVQAAQKRQDATALKNLSKSAADASKAFSGLKNEVSGTFKAISGLIIGNGLLGASLYSVAKSSANTVAALGDNAQITGLNVEAFRELAHAADVAGTSEQEFIGSTLKLGETVKNALGGNQKALDTFFRAGVDLRDSHGNLKTTERLYRELADTFAGMEDGIGKSNLAKDLFGNAKVIPFLNGGSTGLDAMAAEARRFGPVISPEDIKNASDFNNSFGRIKTAISGVSQTIGKELWPHLTELHEEIANGIADGRIWLEKELPGWIHGIKEDLPALKKDLRAAWGTLKDGGRWINDLVKGMGGWKRVIKGVIESWMLWRGLRIAVALGQTVKSVVSLGSAMVTAAPAIWHAVVAAKAFGVALLANPIGLAIAGIAALAGTIYLCVKYWDDIKAATASAWDTTKSVFVSGWNMLPDYIQQPITSVLADVRDFGGLLADAFGKLWDSAIDSLWRRGSAVSDAFDKGFLAGIMEAVNQFSPKELLTDMLNGMVDIILEFDIATAGMNLIKSFGRGILEAWEGIKGEVAAAVTDWIPGGEHIVKGAGKVAGAVGWAASWVGGKLSSINPFAEGGIVRSPQIGLVGEAGPEVIVPVSRPRRGAEMLETAAGMLGMRGGNAGQAQYTISFSPSIHVQGGGDGSIGDQIKRELERAKADFVRTLDRLLADRAYQDQRRLLR